RNHLTGQLPTVHPRGMPADAVDLCCSDRSGEPVAELVAQVLIPFDPLDEGSGGFKQTLLPARLPLQMHPPPTVLVSGHRHNQPLVQQEIREERPRFEMCSNTLTRNTAKRRLSSYSVADMR